MGVLMGLEAHSIASLQQARALLQQLQDSGVATVDEAVRNIEAEVERRGVIASSPVSHRQEFQPCPSPGCSGVLRQCSSSSRLVGAPVMVCSRHCGYSYIDRGSNG